MRRAWKRHVWMSVLRRVHPRITVRAGGNRIRIDLRDGILARALYLRGEWEPELQRLLRAMDLRGSVCLDIGANIGVHTLALSRLVGPAGRVYAFEPEPHNFALLEENLRLNGATNVTALCTAVGDATGTCRLATNPRNRGDNRVLTGGAWASGEVPITTVDESLPVLSGATVKFVKIDVQGYEHHVIRGMQATLARNPDAILAIEVFPAALRAAGTSPRKLIEYLAGLGMTGWEFSPHRLLPLPEPWVYDLFTGGAADLIVSRDGERLGEVLSRWRGSRLRPE